MFRKNFAFFLIVITAVLVLGGQARATFSDVPWDHWAYDAVNYLEENGIVTGYPDGTFRGSKVLSRYEFAMVVSRIFDNLQQMLRDNKEEVPVQTQAVINKLVKEFSPEIEEIRGMLSEQSDKIAALEENVAGIETRLDAITGKIEKMQKAVKDVKPYGDVTMRLQATHTKSKSRDTRARFMLHYGTAVALTDELTFGGQLVSGETTSRTSTFDNFNDAFGTDPLNIDRAYLQWSPKALNGFTTWAGKFQPPWKSMPMVWDSDVMVEGAAQKLTYGNFNFFLGELIPASVGFYLVSQVGYNNLLFENNNLALSYHYINEDAWSEIRADMESGDLISHFVFANLDNPKDYQAFEALWDVKFNAGNFPIMLQANYLMNLADTRPRTPEVETEVDGWLNAYAGRITFNNKPAKPGEWNAWFEYGNIEPNSVLSWMSDSWRGHGDVQYWAVGCNYKFLKDVDFDINYINAERISSDSKFFDVLMNISTRFK